MAALTSAEEQLARSLERVGARTPYVEVMAGRYQGERLRIDARGELTRPAPRASGAVFRAWDGRKWLEAATSGLQASALGQCVDGLLRHLGGDSVKPPPPGPSATTRGEATTPERRPLAEFGLEARLDWARTCRGWGVAVEGIRDAFVDVRTAEEERLFLSTAGARTYQRSVRVAGNVITVAVESGRVEIDRLAAGGVGGAEILESIDEAAVVHVAQEAVALLKAPEPPSGRMDVVLDPSSAGTFAHESFGHGTEADQIVRNRSYLAALLGEQLGPESVTLVDNGALPGAWGSIAFDDEGWPAQRTVLVDHGRFVGVLNDRTSAALLHMTPTGNTRRADFVSRPFVRMTNTYLEPGDQTKEELIAATKDGVLLETFMNGIEDPLGGNMQIKVKKARRIERGELTERYSYMALSGKVLEFLREIRGVSKRSDFELTPGFCGKGHTDILPTGTGGVFVASRAVVGPA